MDKFSIDGCIKSSNLVLIIIPVIIAVILLIQSPPFIRQGESTKIKPVKFILAVAIPTVIIVAILWQLGYVDFSSEQTELCKLKPRK